MGQRGSPHQRRGEDDDERRGVGIVKAGHWDQGHAQVGQLPAITLSISVSADVSYSLHHPPLGSRTQGDWSRV